MSSQSTLLPASVRLDGLIETAGDLTIAGRADGAIEVGGCVVIGEEAVCRAVIRASVAEIRGNVIGDVICAEAITVAAGARVVGDLRAPSISVDADAEVDGKVDLLKPAPEEAGIARARIATRGPAPKRPAVPSSSRTTGRFARMEMAEELSGEFEDMPTLRNRRPEKTGTEAVDDDRMIDDDERSTIRNFAAEAPRDRGIPVAPRPAGRVAVKPRVEAAPAPADSDQDDG